MSNKLDFLLNQANIGHYNKCEIIEIFGFNKESKEAFNIYTLVIFENTKQENIEELLTSKPQYFRGLNNLSWGIKRRIVDIEIIKKLFDELENENKFCIDKPLNIGTLKLLPEQYVPPREDMFNEVQVNHILKNNFYNGSYTLEFFDEAKYNVKFLLDNPKLLLDFNEEINEIISLGLSNVSDRLGNVVYQFPINIFDLKINTIKDMTLNKFTGIKVEIYPKNQQYDLTKLIIRVHENNDNLIARQKCVNVNDKISTIALDDSFGTHIEIIDKNSSLIIYKHKLNIIKQMHLNMGLIENQKRVFELDGEIKKINVTHNASNNILGKEKDKSYGEWIRDRKYEQELKELESTKFFVQYFGNEEEKALKDIRELIDKYGDKGVYLWDPYLSANDIKNTLYFCKKTYLPLKAITGLKHIPVAISKPLNWFQKLLCGICNKVKIDCKLKVKTNSKIDAIKNMTNEFQQDDKQFLFLNLEVRGKIGSNGYDFHDRFLIFPQEKVKVWSLGISVNQLGASHHILQEVKNAQHILNAFNQLWDELDNEECLVWKNN